MAKISIISVWNDKEKLDAMLKTSLQRADDSLYEPVLIDNRDNKFESAAAALNHGAAKASGVYYLFLHQDVQFLKNGWLKDLIAQIEGEEFGLAGAVGETPTRIERVNRRGSFFEGESKHRRSSPVNIDTPTKVQTVDEFCLLVPANLFDSRGFNENICSGWHLYGVEYSLFVNQETDLDVVVVPVDVWHGSGGMEMGVDYYQTLARVLREHRVESCYTTCGHWPGNPLFAQALAVWIRATDVLPPKMASATKEKTHELYTKYGWFLALRRFDYLLEELRKFTP